MLPALAACQSSRLVAVCDPNPSAIRQLFQTAAACKLPPVEAFSDLSGFLAIPEIDAVYIATPNDTHRPLVERCAAAGKHVVCEKPMATTHRDALAMADACQKANIQYATAYDQRYHPLHQRLARMIRDGELGKVTQVRLHYACWLPEDWSNDNWRVDHERAGGGAGIDLAPHGIDLISHLLQDEWTNLTALQQRCVHQYAVDDGTVLLGKLGQGTLATLHVAYNCPEAFPRRQLDLIGTRAMARATDTMGQTPGGTLQLIDSSGGQKTWQEDQRTGRSPFLGQIETLSKAILLGEAFPGHASRDAQGLGLLLQALQQSV